MATPKSNAKPEEGWHTARLIPTTGIGGAEEQERRATSSLLAVMFAVPEFGRALLAQVGAPAGKIRTFAEVQIKDLDSGTTSIPDGAILVERGQTRWCALLEVKTGGHDLAREQVERYLDLARVNAFDAVITLSNAITSSTSTSPITVDARKTKRVDLRHLSWYQVTTEAILQHRHRKLSDPDQAWLLGELIEYLENDKSGAGGFDDMGDQWVTVRDEAKARTLNANSKGAREVARRWEQFSEYLSLVLEQYLGRDVTVNLAKNSDAAQRVDAAVRRMVDDGCLVTSIRVPDAAAPIDIEVNLRTREVTTGISVAAPRDGRPATRINWLLRQLKDARPETRVEVRYPNTRDVTSGLLRDLSERQDRLLHPTDPKREPREFTVAWARPMGLKRNRLAGSFVGDTKSQLLDFYRDTVQTLRPWIPPAPKLASAASATKPTITEPELPADVAELLD
jgi:hypothetical protein